MGLANGDCHMPEVTSTTGGVNVTLLPSCYIVIDMIGELKV